MKHLFHTICLSVAVMFAVSCGSTEESTTTSTPPEPSAAEPASIVVYSGRGAVLVDPLFTMFTEETGINVEVRYEKSTETLANRIATEGAETEADVFFAQDSGYLGALAENELLAPLPSDVIATVDERYRAESGRWLATSGRARVLVYSPERVSADELPTSLAELAEPTFKGRIGWAPSNSSFQAHVSALRSLWGDEKTRTWLEQMKSLEPTVYPKNSPQVKAVSSGEIDIGWVNHYYLHKLRAADPELKAANHSFAADGDAGNIMMLAGAGLVTHSDNTEEALKLIEFLVSEKAQNYFTQTVYEYPTRPGIKHHPDVPPIGTKLALIDQKALTDVGPTLQMLRDLELQ